MVFDPVSTVFGPVYLVDGFSETGIFRHLSHYLFVVRKFVTKKFFRVIFFLPNVQNLM